MTTRKFKERQLEVFRAVYNSGSISAAARQLGVSQPSLSMTIRRFEDEVGTPLFERISGRLIPTGEAALIFAEIDRVYGQFDRLSEAIEGIVSGDQGIFRFGTTPSIGLRLVPKAIKRLKDNRPKRLIHCDHLSQRDIRDYLAFGKGACVTTIVENDDPSVESLKIGQGTLVCLMPADHPLAGEREIHPRQLRDYSLISFAPHTPHGSAIDEVYRRGGETRHTSVYIQFVEAAVTMVLEGIGVAILDQFSVMDTAALGLVSIPMANSMEIPAYVQWYTHRPRPTAVAELITALRDVVDEASKSNLSSAVSLVQKSR